ncbi:MAG: hypothetical protein IKN36_01045 [Clostridia bacterium]|nr:hypothetical protein [Clostridia bacterium]MBR7033061.1 hypothetical protein [Clostridia bacterium]
MSDLTKGELIEMCDARYVRRAECGEQMNDIRGKLHNDDKRLAVIELQVKINNWLSLAIAGGVIALVIKIFLGA